MNLKCAGCFQTAYVIALNYSLCEQCWLDIVVLQLHTLNDKHKKIRSQLKKDE